jgi:hypothetical protein
METTVLLCDAAEAVNGKLYVLGGGWTAVQSADRPVSMSLGIVVTVPWDRTNMPHELRIELLDADGQVVRFGDQPVSVQTTFEVGRPPGVKAGSSFNSPMAWNFAGLVLPAGGYEFKVSIGGDPVASRPFMVIPPPGTHA